MTYNVALDLLYNRLPLFSRDGAKAFKADLHNTLALCALLDDPHKKLKYVHVAGTNGKGSVCHMLAAIFQKNNYRTGLYTSPHLYDFRERIKINGELVPEDFVCAFVERTLKYWEKINPSFFELTFVMALDYFAQQNVDVAIIETGLGGRLDSTNVIQPLLSIITNIGWDHTDILGDSLEKIASEKAGIIKPGIPVVVGEYLPETKDIFIASAAAKESEIVFAADKYEITTADTNLTLVDKSTNEKLIVKTDLAGIYQRKNIKTVFAALHFLENNFKPDRATSISALAEVQSLTGLKGRWQKIHSRPDVIFDVAHNADGIRQLAAQLTNETYAHLHIVFGMVKDKDVAKVLELLPGNATYYFTKARTPRALPENELLNKAQSFFLKGNSFESVSEAFERALLAANTDDLVLVCGSVFVVAEASEALPAKIFAGKY